MSYELTTRVRDIVEALKVQKYYIDNGEEAFRKEYGDEFADGVLYLFDTENEYNDPDSLNLEEGDLREAVARAQYRIETVAAKEYFFKNGEEAFRKKYGDEFVDEVLEFFQIEKEIIESEND